MSESAADTFRWQAFFQHAAQPIFLLNRRRRILFVNRAFESCTGLTFAEVRGRVCRRRGRSASLDRSDALLSALAPPAEAWRGQTCDVHRRAQGSLDWWAIHFTPLAGAQDLLGILGTIRVIQAPAEPSFTLPEKLMALRDRQATRYQLSALPADTPVLRRMHEQALLAAQTCLPIALIGEPGAGKEWLARAIHGQSPQRERYFVCLDARKLPADQLGEVLFGPRRRQMAFGAVYLREPAALPREWQSRLAEAVRLQAGPEFPRLFVGFCSEPRADIDAGRLLEEFWCAVSPITIAVPPLRERLSQLDGLIEVFLGRAGELGPHGVKRVSTEAVEVLRSHRWPDNLRELQEVLCTACRHAKGGCLEASDLPFHVRHGVMPTAKKMPLDVILEQVERRLIALALKLTDNNQTRAAELLEIWRPRLVRRLEKFGEGQAPG